MKKSPGRSSRDIKSVEKLNEMIEQKKIISIPNLELQKIENNVKKINKWHLFKEERAQQIEKYIKHKKIHLFVRTNIS